MLNISHALRFFAAVFALIMLSACVSNTLDKSTKVSPEQAQETLPGLTDEPYKMQIGDVLDVKFLMNPELDEQVIVRPDGRISTVIAQDVMAFGRTPYQLQQTLMRYYKEHLTNPKLSVIVRSYAPSRFYVLGEVLQPGEFVSVDPNITLLQAIARAGGLRNTADRDKIVVIRRRDGKKAQVMHANFDKASEGQDLMQDVRLANRDVVFVSRMGVADVHLYYEQYLQRFISPSLGIGYQLNSRID